MPPHKQKQVILTGGKKKKKKLTQLTKFRHQKRFSLAESSKTAEILNQEAIIYNEMLTHP